MKWYHNEYQEDVFNYHSADHFINIFDERQVPLRGHAVFWSVYQFVQQWVKDKAESGDLESLETDIFDRVTDLITRYAGRIPDWDVFNEVIHGDFFKNYFGENIWDRVIDKILEIDPNVGIVFNDYQLLSSDWHTCFLDHIKNSKHKAQGINEQIGNYIQIIFYNFRILLLLDDKLYIPLERKCVREDPSVGGNG